MTRRALAVRHGRQEHAATAPRPGTPPCGPARCQKEGGEKKIADGQKKLADVGPQGRSSSRRGRRSSPTARRTSAHAVQYLATQDAALKKRKPADEDAKTLPKRAPGMLYEAAWAGGRWPTWSMEAARAKIQQDRWQKRRDEVAKATPQGQQPPPVAMPDVDAARGAGAAGRDGGAQAVPRPDHRVPRPGHQRRRPLRAGRAARPSAASTTRRSSCCKGAGGREGAVGGAGRPHQGPPGRLPARPRRRAGSSTARRSSRRRDAKADDKKAAEKLIETARRTSRRPWSRCRR